MEKKKTTLGRKADFPGEDCKRMAVVLPQSTVQELNIFVASSTLSRNQAINQAIEAFLQLKKEEKS